jgi:predicted metal-dependent HD superfamily phosphohydrolase
VLDLLRTLYENPPRPYHSWRHVRAVLGALNRWLGPDLPPALLQAALWHDAIYDPKAEGNEEKSADACVTQLRAEGADEAVSQRAAALILATKAHTPPDDSLDALALLDADLWILGASGRVYDRYAALIRREYAHVEGDAYRAGRAAVLERFLQRERLYLGDWPGVSVREARARENLKREIASLRG